MHRNSSLALAQCYYNEIECWAHIHNNKTKMHQQRIQDCTGKLREIKKSYKIRTIKELTSFCCTTGHTLSVFSTSIYCSGCGWIGGVWAGDAPADAGVGRDVGSYAKWLHSFSFSVLSYDVQLFVTLAKISFPWMLNDNEPFKNQQHLAHRAQRVRWRSNWFMVLHFEFNY